MPQLPYGAPVPVSPLIRGARFALLIAGIFYGRSKKKIYARREKLFQEEETRKKIIRDQEMVILRKKIAAEEKEMVRLFESGKLFDPPNK